MKQFTHLHLHTHYSLLDGMSRMPELMDRAKELGFSAIGLTDHGVLYGAIEFYEEARKRGIKPILGCEVYMATRSRFDREPKLDDRQIPPHASGEEQPRLQESRQAGDAGAVGRLLLQAAGGPRTAGAISRGSHLPFGLSVGRNSEGAPGWERGEGAGISAPLPRFVWRGQLLHRNPRPRHGLGARGYGEAR